MDNLQWFKFNPSKWVMGRIQRCPEVTQARFIRLCCLYWSKGCELSVEDAILDIDSEHFDLLVAKKVIEIEDDELIWIDFLSEQMKEASTRQSNQSEKGRIGNLKRWHSEQYKMYVDGKITLDEAEKIATQSPPNRKTSQIREDKRREDKRREDKRDKRDVNSLLKRHTDILSGINPTKSNVLYEWLTYIHSKDPTKINQFQLQRLVQKFNETDLRTIQKSVNDSIENSYLKIVWQEPQKNKVTWG